MPGHSICLAWPLFPAFEAGVLRVALIGVGFAVAATNGLVDFYAGHFGIDLAFVDAIAGDGFAAFFAGCRQAAKGEEEEGQSLHVFAER